MSMSMAVDVVVTTVAVDVDVDVIDVAALVPAVEIVVVALVVKSNVQPAIKNVARSTKIKAISFFIGIHLAD